MQIKQFLPLNVLQKEVFTPAAHFPILYHEKIFLKKKFQFLFNTLFIWEHSQKFYCPLFFSIFEFGKFQLAQDNWYDIFFIFCWKGIILPPTPTRNNIPMRRLSDVQISSENCFSRSRGKRKINSNQKLDMGALKCKNDERKRKNKWKFSKFNVRRSDGGVKLLTNAKLYDYKLSTSTFTSSECEILWHYRSPHYRIFHWFFAIFQNIRLKTLG